MAPGQVWRWVLWGGAMGIDEPITDDSDRPAIDVSDVDVAVPCPMCRYDLRGLVITRCPECGARLRLVDPQLIRGARRERRLLYLAWLAQVAGVAGMIGSMILLDPVAEPENSVLLIVLVMLGFGFVSFVSFFLVMGVALTARHKNSCRAWPGHIVMIVLAVGTWLAFGATLVVSISY